VAHRGRRRPQTQRLSRRPGFDSPAHSHNRMTLAIYSRATEGMQDPARPPLKRPLLDPAVDTPLKETLSSTVRAIHFLAICRTFRSGGTRIRTGDTMIFSHMQKPLGMRKTRIGKRIYVHGVLLDTITFCPYCCATVDTAFVSLRGTGGSRTPKNTIVTTILLCVVTGSRCRGRTPPLPIHGRPRGRSRITPLASGPCGRGTRPTAPMPD
jgi:hypothetical protein